MQLSRINNDLMSDQNVIYISADVESVGQRLMICEYSEVPAFH